MKSSHLIALTATIVACSAATASARPAIEPPGSQASKPSAATSASIATHREQISTQQWQRSQPQPAAAPLTDRTVSDDGLPLALVLVGVTVPLGLLIIAIAKPVLSYGRHRHHPTTVA
jgi:pyruvate/2-oxoglutarate dehydrogenase complex dihydrolipoamide acyltransferase (E2) component